jgi:hypothetical protein
MPDTTALNPELLAGAAHFDQMAQRLGEVSAASFDRDGTEDYRAMVDVLGSALAVAMSKGPEFRFGFLLPIADLIDGHRLGCYPSDEWTGEKALQEAAGAFAQRRGALNG